MEREELYNAINGGRNIAGLAFPALIRKVYTWMTLAMVITGLTAYMVADTGMVFTIAQSPGIMWGMIIAELALVWGLSGAIRRLSLAAATLMFVVYSVLNGATLSFIFLAYTMESVASVFFITAATFGVMALIGYTTKSDLTSVGKLLFMALIGLIIATLVNLFIGSSTMAMIISYAGVLIFVGLTAYDSQKIKRMLMECDEVNDSTQKLAILGSLTLYLDFVNLFLYLLRILGDRK